MLGAVIKTKLVSKEMKGCKGLELKILNKKNQMETIRLIRVRSKFNRRLLRSSRKSTMTMSILNMVTNWQMKSKIKFLNLMATYLSTPN